ncbi:MAG TPA: VWA domain-containing protein [Casimicrobiaceae bacterium]|nr:VWA domain-containing protein [Casimicrobiaceae bacterium]
MTGSTTIARGAGFAVLPPRGFLADNVLHFVRVLRGAGLPLGPAKVIDALAAVEAVGVDRRSDFRAALAAVLCSRRDHLELFDQAFELFWRDPKLLERMAAALLPRAKGRTGDEPAPPDVPARLAQALTPPRDEPPREESDEVTLDAAFTFSPREVLQTHDFATMTAEELAQVKRMIARLRLPLPKVAMRRTRPDDRGARVDLRATLRRAMGAAGAAAPLAFRARTQRTPPLVVLCDISGSMDRYTRMMLHFLHAITNDRHRVHVLLFGTRLTNVTRHLKHRDVDVALACVAGAVADWAGGTRIGASLAEFNRRWSRRLLAQNAVVLLISDGLDAEAGVGLEGEMERLAKSCRRLVWLNPLLRYADFEARPAGIRAMLPWVDDFLPVHNLASLEALAVALTRSGEGREPAGSGRRFVEAFRPAGGRRPRKRRGAA